MTESKSAGPENIPEHSERQKSAGLFDSVLATAFAQAANCMAITNLAGAFLNVNQAFANLLGYSLGELAAMNIRDILHSDDLQLHELLVSGADYAHVNFDLIERYVHRSGRTIWVKTFATLVPGNDNPDVIVSFILDITEEKNTHEQERRMRFLIDNSSDYISLSDADEQIVYLNRAGRKLLGLPNETDDPIPSMQVASSHERMRLIQEIIPKVQETGYWEGALNLLNQETGEEIPAHVKSLRISDSVTSEPAGRATVIHDLRPDLAARALSKEREENLQNAVDLAQIGTWSVDLQNKSISFSSRVGELMGLTGGTISFDELSGIHPDDLAAVTEEFERALALGTDGLFDTEHRILQGDAGEFRFVHSVGKVICDSNGHPSIVIGTLQDITDQKTARQELERQIASHSIELFHANRQLQELNSYLQQSNAELEQFAYVASHDLQEPLRKISVFAGMLNKYPAMTGQALGTVEKISQASNRMIQLIKDLLDFSRLLNRDQRTALVDLNVVVSAVLNDFELTISEKSALVHVDPLPTIEGVPIQMNQLFNNLIGNALKFVRPGVSPEIIIRSRMLDAGESSGHEPRDGESEYHFITVSDNGIGFESKYAEQIFDVFKRLHTPLEYPGSGIGLALCRRILQNHGGIMTAQSEPGSGTTISLILPSSQ